MLLGAHFEWDVNNPRAVLQQASALGATVIQVFGAAERSMEVPLFSPTQREEFKKELGSRILVLHAPLMCSITSQKDHFYRMSVRMLLQLLELGDTLGAFAVVTHVGSVCDQPMEKAVEKVHAALRKVCSKEYKTRLLLENDAGGGSRLGSVQFLQETFLKGGYDPSKVGVVLDTLHAYAAGVPLLQASEFEFVVRSFGPYLQLVHLNAKDPKVKFGKHLDRHNTSFSKSEDLSLPWVTQILPFISTLPMVIERADSQAVQEDFNDVSAIFRSLNGQPASN